MELTISKLAVPRKLPVIQKDASYTLSSTQQTVAPQSPFMTIITPITPASTVRYFPRIYQGNAPDATPTDEWLCYAEVYAVASASSSSDTTKGRLIYRVINDTEIETGIYKKIIQCELPDGTTFTINPGYYLGSGLYCVGISFYCYNCTTVGYNTKQIYDDTLGFAPKYRFTRTDDGENLECAADGGTFDITVKMDVYDLSRHEIVSQQLCDGIDSNSYLGRGGLYTYNVCIGATYKDKNAAQLDPSGEWYTEDKSIKTDIDVQTSWT